MKVFPAFALLAATLPHLAQAADPSLSPAILADFTSDRQAVNLTPHQGKSSHQGVESLELGEHRNGFRVTDVFLIEGGLGASVGDSFWFNGADIGPEIWGQVGLVPMMGKEVRTVRFVKNSADLAKLKKRAVPMRVSDLKGWAKGDSAQFSTKGGVVFFAGASAHGLSVGLAYLAQGQFQTYVERIDDTHMLVQVTEAKLDSLKVKAGATVASLGREHYQKVSQSLSFRVDVSSPEGVKVYQDMMRGNFARSAQSSAVKPWRKSESTQRGDLNQFSIGIPLLFYAKSSWGKITEEERTKFLNNGTEVQAKYGIYLSDQKTKRLSAHTQDMRAFLGVAYRDGKGSRHTAGRLRWVMENDTSTSDSLRTSMRAMVRKTGMREELSLHVPESQDLRYTRLALELGFSETQTQRLVETASRISARELETRVLALRDQYLRVNGSDVDGVCADYNAENYDCAEALEVDLKQGAVAMANALTSLASARTDEAFAVAYANFGKAMMANQFLFRLGLQLAGEGVAADVTVEGTEVSAFRRALEARDNGTFRASVKGRRALSPVGTEKAVEVEDRAAVITADSLFR